MREETHFGQRVLIGPPAYVKLQASGSEGAAVGNEADDAATRHKTHPLSPAEAVASPVAGEAGTFEYPEHDENGTWTRMQTVEPGIYFHHKGGYYTVLFTVHESTNDRAGEQSVIYISLSTGRRNGRKLEEFVEPVTWPDGVERSRFVRVWKVGPDP